MAAWTSGELDTIGAAEEVALASVRSDGSLRKPVTIWIVRDGDDVYVRSVNGRGSSWFRGVQDRHEAHLRAGSIEKNVVLVDTDAANDAVDDAYRSKYDRRYPSIVPRIVAPVARAATLKLMPR